MDVTCSPSFYQNFNSGPVLVKPSGNLIRLCFAESNAFAGLFDAPVLVELIQDSGVSLDAIFPERDLKSKRVGGASSLIPTVTAQIIVYGNSTNMYDVGDRLSDAGLYLQHPSTDIDPHVEYFNPQYLLAPGETFPRPTTAVAPIRGKDHPLGEMLRTQALNQLSQVFDDAIGPAQYTVVEQSRRLSATLEE